VLIFAYDGSLNGDWVAHYAVRFALHAPERRLRLIHLEEPGRGEGARGRIARIEAECGVVGVRLDAEIHPARPGAVAQQLLELAGDDPADTLLAGTRARPRNLAFLAGTVSARLLDRATIPVVALRVVHPGILGQPHSMLLPLSGHPAAAARVVRTLSLFGSELEVVHVLMVKQVSHLRFGMMRPSTAERLLRVGREEVARLERRIQEGLAPHRFEMDSSVVVSDDPPKEILVHAGRLRSRIICLGATERSLPERVVFGNPIEQVLRETPCDVAVHRVPP